MQWLTRIVLTLLILAGCPPRALSQDTGPVAPPPPTEALLVLAIAPPITSGGFRLRAIDLESPAFEAGELTFSYGGWLDPQSQQVLGATNRSPVRFVARTVPVGTYVATFEYFNDTNVVSNMKLARCTSEQAAVIEVSAGQINVVRSNAIYPPGILGRLNSEIPDSMVLQEFAAISKNQTNWIYDAILVHPVATVSWTPRQRNTRHTDCENASQLRILKRFGQ